MVTSDSEEWLMIIIIIVVFIVVIIFSPKAKNQDEECKRVYGSQFAFVAGDRSPDLCVTRDGQIRYYDLIK